MTLPPIQGEQEIFDSENRSSQTKQLYGADVIIVEGILVFYSANLLEQMDMKVFVDSDSDTRLCRRSTSLLFIHTVKRDVAERGRDVEGILNQYFKFVKPAFEEYIQPSMKHADLIVPRGVENTGSFLPLSSLSGDQSDCQSRSRHSSSSRSKNHLGHKTFDVHSQQRSHLTTNSSNECAFDDLTK